VSDVAQKLSQAFALHKAGQIAKAEPLYREILQKEPKHFDALHMLGVAYLQTGRNEDAARLITRAVALQQTPIAFNNQGNALQALKRPVEALASFDKALALQPD
jgi:Tfp pilus assembly protein PilF